MMRKAKDWEQDGVDVKTFPSRFGAAMMVWFACAIGVDSIVVLTDKGAKTLVCVSRRAITCRATRTPYTHSTPIPTRFTPTYSAVLPLISSALRAYKVAVRDVKGAVHSVTHLLAVVSGREMLFTLSKHVVSLLPGARVMAFGARNFAHFELVHAKHASA